MEGDTPIPIGRPWEHRLGEGAGELLRGVSPACGRPEDLNWDRWEPLIAQQSLMGGGVVGLHEGLMALLELRWRARQGKLVVIQPPLNIKMGLHEVLITLAFGALDRLMLNLQAATDRFKVVRGVSHAAVVREAARSTHALVILAVLLALASPARAGGPRCVTYEEKTMVRLQTLCGDGSRAVSTWSPTLQRWQTIISPPPGLTTAVEADRSPTREDWREADAASHPRLWACARVRDPGSMILAQDQALKPRGAR
jgi:hypothetical protein